MIERQYVIKLFTLLGKFYKHKSKFTKKKTLFLIYKSDLENYLISLSYVESELAQKSFQYLSKYINV